MATRKCCVGGCNATNKTHRLFSIPKDDKLQELWLSFLIPTNIELSGLSKDQLVNKRVCQNHFDRNQFDGMGNRLRHGYPCLFTAKEVLHGIPLSSSVGDHLSDHNYESLQNIPDDSIESTTVHTVIIEGDHSYCASSSFPADEPMEIDHCKVLAPMEEKHAHISKNMEQDCTLVTRKLCVKKIVKKLSAKRDTKCVGFVQRVKKLTFTENKTQKPFEERFAKAQNLSQNHAFLNNFNKMTKHAQDFLLMQLKLADKKKKAMRFTTNEKLLSLTLMKESPKGYRLLKKIFKLPSKRTLNRLAEKITFRVGLNDNVFNLLQKKSLKWDTKKKLCTIVFDEVALMPHLTYVEAEDEVKGFKDLGDEKELKFADHALVIMIRGVCSNWRQPICYYFCEGTTSSAALVRILKEVVAKIDKSGLIPIAFICDQGSTFRMAMKMLIQETQRKKNLNGKHHDGTIEICGQQMSIVYDPPHLLKGLRNNLLTKNMLFNGKIASWDDILTVYNADCQLGHTRMNKKLTARHVIADKMKKMKVGVAAQVLSAQTSAMLKYTSLFKTTVSGEKVSETMGTTGEAVEFIDNLFDSVNGSRRSTVKGKLRGPIKPKSQHFGFWREAREILKNMKFVDSASKRAITNKKQYHVRVPSLDGWVTTLESFERMCKLLFEKYNIQYLYPRNINQDPLENFFGRIRAINYRNVNPDAYTFINAFKSLLISNVMGPHSIYSNCEEDDGETLIDFFNLLKQSPVEDKENIPVNVKIIPKKAEHINITEKASNVINEKMRVHSSAYTAGYLCRKLTKKFNCTNCTNTYISKEKENIHEWIMHREYKQLKNSNLAYPSKKFLLLYKDISDYIHGYMNNYAHNKNIGEKIKTEIQLKYSLDWFGCTTHKTYVNDWFLKLILRLHIHNWCNIINKILNGAIDEKYVNKMVSPQKMAYSKYKALRLRNKNK